MFKKNLKNISYQSIGQIVPKAMMFLFVMYLAKTLGGLEYGKYEFALSLGYLIGIFFELGGNMILTKHVARNFYSSIYYALKIRVTSVLLTLLVFYSVLYIFGLYEDTRQYIIYASLGIAFSSLMNLFFAFFRGAGAMKYEAIVLLVQKALFILLALAFIQSGETGENVLLGFMFSMMAGLVIILLIFKSKKAGYLTSDRKEAVVFRDYIKDVMTLALVEIFASIYFRISQIMLEYFRGFEEVSTYAAAYRIVEVFTNIPSILLLALFPTFARLAAKNIPEFRLNFLKMIKYLFGLGSAAAIICWFTGEYFFSLIGNDYSNSYIVLRYLCFPMIFLFPNYIVTQGLIALNRNILFAKILFTALAMNILLSVILIPLYGAVGSAISIGICEIFIFAAGVYYIMKITKTKNA